ncbi:CpsD/CapB family tyrosine-protein kinase [Bacterioplanoides sp.]|uniref:CpsD/CapB family tyrosine-protein kinase n=1 Tax=Bacterioplanoides sp. TaxID=2066072 RepID=UPI003B001E4F
MASISDVVKRAKEAKVNPVVGERNSDKELRKVHSTEDDGSFNNIKYTSTKVIPVAHKTLSENRIIAHNKEDPASVPFSMLRTKVLHEMRANEWSTLAISAPTPGAGKSLVATNLAISIAMEANQTVLLVDMDLRQPSVHQYFSVEPELGIQDFLERGVPISDIMFNPGIERLSVLPGRKRMLNSSEALATPMVKALTKELKNRYESRIIIYDLPPYLVNDDALVFLPYIDCSLLVVESGVSTKEEIEESLHLAQIKPMLGTVLNKYVQSKKINVY